MPKRPERPTGFAQRLRELREAAGLTQQQLAERAGLYPFSVAKLEQAVQEPTWPTVLDLADALGVSVGDFVCEGQPTAMPKRAPGRPPKPPTVASGPFTSKRPNLNPPKVNKRGGKGEGKKGSG
jgi:transcriptional regulator with XRE-family HTH domain